MFLAKIHGEMMRKRGNIENCSWSTSHAQKFSKNISEDCCLLGHSRRRETDTYKMNILDCLIFKYKKCLPCSLSSKCLVFPLPIFSAIVFVNWSHIITSSCSQCLNDTYHFKFCKKRHQDFPKCIMFYLKWVFLYFLFFNYFLHCSSGKRSCQSLVSYF